MKTKSLFFQLALIANIVFSQEYVISSEYVTLPWSRYDKISSTIKFDFCEEMVQDKDNFVFQIFLIHEQDTLIFPQIGKYEFLNPIIYYNLTVDTTVNDDLKLLFINSRYIYPLKTIRAYLFQEKVDFCIKMIQKRSQFRNQFNFIQYDGAYTALSVGKRKKVKR